MAFVWSLRSRDKEWACCYFGAPHEASTGTHDVPVFSSSWTFLRSIGWTLREDERPVCPEHSEPLLDQISGKAKAPCPA